MTLNRKKTLRSRKGGFTLIEVALAIVVVALGLLAVFSLLSAGLNAAHKAIAETNASIFANSVFNAMRTQSLRVAESAQHAQQWSDYWNTFRVGSASISVAAPETWSPQTLSVKASPANEINSLKFADKLFHGSAATDIINNSLRYRLSIFLPGGDPTGPYDGPLGVGPSYWEDEGGDPWYQRRAMATLRVWDGLTGGSSDTNAMVFYTEFNNPGDL